MKLIEVNSFPDVCAGGEVLTGMPSDSESPIVYNFSCPMYGGFQSCSYSETPPQACLNHQLDAVVVCYEGE